MTIIQKISVNISKISYPCGNNHKIQWLYSNLGFNKLCQTSNWNRIFKEKKLVNLLKFVRLLIYFTKKNLNKHQKWLYEVMPVSGKRYCPHLSLSNLTFESNWNKIQRIIRSNLIKFSTSLKFIFPVTDTK